MKKLDVVVVECGLDYMDRVGVLEKRCETVEEAIWEVTSLGYEVIPNDMGGENVAYEDYIAITVSPPNIESDVYEEELKKLTCYECDGDFTEGVWVDGREWTFYCPECYQSNEEQFPSWKYAEKRYLTKDNNTDEHWRECFWCNTISHEAVIDVDDNDEVCPECKRAGAMLKV